MNWSHCVKEPDVSDAQKIPTLLGWTCLHDVSIISRLLTGKRVSPAKKVENKIDISRQQQSLFYSQSISLRKVFLSCLQGIFVYLFLPLRGIGLKIEELSLYSSLCFLAKPLPPKYPISYLQCLQLVHTAVGFLFFVLSDPGIQLK